MTRDEIFNRVQDIFKDIFDDDELVLKNNTNSADIEEWDSLNHINLVSAIEKDFDVKFSLVELISLKDVGEMIDLIVEKT